jgi:hypothetical protein
MSESILCCTGNRDVDVLLFSYLHDNILKYFDQTNKYFNSLSHDMWTRKIINLYEDIPVKRDLHTKKFYFNTRESYYHLKIYATSIDSNEILDWLKLSHNNVNFIVEKLNNGSFHSLHEDNIIMLKNYLDNGVYPKQKIIDKIRYNWLIFLFSEYDLFQNIDLVFHKFGDSPAYELVIRKVLSKGMSPTQIMINLSVENYNLLNILSEYNHYPNIDHLIRFYQYRYDKFLKYLLKRGDSPSQSTVNIVLFKCQLDCLRILYEYGKFPDQKSINWLLKNVNRFNKFTIGNMLDLLSDHEKYPDEKSIILYTQSPLYNHDYDSIFPIICRRYQKCHQDDINRIIENNNLEMTKVLCWYNNFPEHKSINYVYYQKYYPIIRVLMDYHSLIDLNIIRLLDKFKFSNLTTFINGKNTYYNKHIKDFSLLGQLLIL